MLQKSSTKRLNETRTQMLHGTGIFTYMFNGCFWFPSTYVLPIGRWTMPPIPPFRGTSIPTIDIRLEFMGNVGKYSSPIRRIWVSYDRCQDPSCFPRSSTNVFESCSYGRNSAMGITYGCWTKNNGTPKWMVYKGKPYWDGWFGGTIIVGNTHI